MSKELKVFHGMVNYGTQAGYFSRGLREKGIVAISVAGPDKIKRSCDITLESHRGRPNRIANIFIDILQRIRWFKKYNIFHFYFGTTLFPYQIDLPFYKIFRKKVVMEYLGYDVQLYKYSIDKYRITNVKYYHSKYESLKADRRKLIRLNFEKYFLDKQLVCAPYLSEFVPKSEVLPLAIDLNDYEYSPKAAPGDEIIIMHAPTNRGNKGTKYIIGAIQRLKDKGIKIRFMLVENISHAELRKRYKECDIFIDQILGGWYGTASVEAMAIGRPTVCFLRESYFAYIDYSASIPIINANPDNLYEVLINVIRRKGDLPEIGKKSREFVENIHSLDKCVDKLIGIYEKL